VLIDFIDVPEEAKSSLNVAGGSKLFSFIVDDLNAAKELLRVN